MARDNEENGLLSFQAPSHPCINMTREVVIRCLINERVLWGTDRSALKRVRGYVGVHEKKGK